MIHLRSLALKSSAAREGFPFTIPAFRTLDRLEFQGPITLFIGENGSGKSTLLEAVALAARATAVGAHSTDEDASLAYVREFAAQLTLGWARRTHRGFFLRAEDVFGFTAHIGALTKDLAAAEEEFEGRLSGYGLQLAKGAVLGQRRQLVERYGENLDANSHGETFLRIFQERFVPGGLYLLDEPEAPLSVQRQLALVSMLREMVRQDCQFLIATHSVILMSLPEAHVFSFDGGLLREIPLQEVEPVRLLRDFLNNTDAYLRRL